MGRNIYRVQTQYGEVTRQSERPYKFVVISFGQDESYLRSRHEAEVVYFTKLAARYRRAEATGLDSDYPNDPKYRWPAEQWREWAEDVERKAAKVFEPAPASLMVHGWSQSADGAGKMARDAEKYHYLNIAVLPVK